MKDCILLTNVGGHDLSEENGSFKINIIEPIINELNKNNNVLKVILFVTKQYPPHPKDTDLDGERIKEMLPKTTSINLNDIDLKYINCPPSDYDEMLKYYKHELVGIMPNTDIYVNITGGTPAQSLGISFNSILLYKNIVKLIYLPRNKQIPVLLDLSNEILKTFSKERYSELLLRQKYLMASEMGDKAGLLKSFEVMLLKSKEYMKLFDFQSSLDLLNKILEYNISNEIRGEVEDLKTKCELILSDPKILTNKYFKKQYCLIKNLSDTIDYKWVEGDYIDFLGRLFRFDEACLKFIIEKELNVIINKQYLNNFKDDVVLMGKLTEKINNFNPNFEAYPNRDILRLIAEIKVNKFKENYFALTSKRIPKLVELRNKCIIAHNFEPISKEVIIKHYPSENGDVIEDKQKLMNKLEKLLHK